MMGIGLTRQQQKDRQAYANQVFTNRAEYFYYRDLRTLITEMLSSENRRRMGIGTRRLLNICARLVDRARKENRDCDWKCYGGVLVMEYMRDSEEFQREYKILRVNLEAQMNACNKKTNPAENIMTAEEICLVLLEKPDFINLCAKPPKAAQFTACGRFPQMIQFIDEPCAELVDAVVERNTKNILLVNPLFRTLKSEIAALNAGVLGLNQINKVRLIENDYNAENWNPEELINLVVQVERQAKSLSAEQLETFRLNAVGWEKIRSIRYMHAPISKPVKEKALRVHPIRVGDIQHQYPELQKMALFYGFQVDCKKFYLYPKRLISILPDIHSQLENPGIEIAQIYVYLRHLYDDLPNIKTLRYQNEQIHMGCLYLALVKKIDINRVFALFQNPSQNVRDFFETKRAEQEYNAQQSAMYKTTNEIKK